MRICIVTPGHLASNPRAAKEAAALAEAGYDVHVVHGHYEPFYATNDGAFAHGFSTTPVRFGPHLAPRLTYLRQSLTYHATRKFSRTPLRSVAARYAISPVARDLTAAASGISADLYIAHYDAALPAVQTAARRHGGRYAFDAEDFHPGDLPDEPRFAHEKAIIDAVEARTLPGAAFVTAAAPGIADAYSRQYNIARPTVVLNVFPRAVAANGPTPRGTAKGPSVYWFSQTLGPDRGLECAVAAIAKSACRPHLYLRGKPSPGYSETLTAMAREAGVADRLHLLPVAPPGEMVRLAAAYDVGLVGETGLTHNRRIAITNKQFTYLLAGIPMAMSDVPAHRAFAEEAGGAAYLYRTDDADALAARLDELLGDPDRLAIARTRAYSLGQERFNWDVEKAKLLDVVAGVLHGSDRSDARHGHS